MFGPQFQEHSIVVKDPTGGFEYATFMYGTMLCVAKIYFSDGCGPLVLERYIDFDDSGS